MARDQYFDAGIVKRSNKNYLVVDLPETVGVNPSLLNAPIYVLHPNSAKKVDELSVSWQSKVSLQDGSTAVVKRRFKFLRSGATPFPTATHAMYLDILLAMFASNWNPEGILHFRYSDVLKIAGKHSKSTCRTSIQDTILRYRRHQTEWENLWNGINDTIAFNIIRRSSLVDESTGEIVKSSPRKSLRKENWHSVVFDKEIVSALKNEKKRIFLTEIFGRLPHGTFVVYRYYYGYPDSYLDHEKKTLHPNWIWRTYDQLLQVFRWHARKDRFQKWIRDQLENLVKEGLIDPPLYRETAVGVHCKNADEIKKSDKVIVFCEHEKPENLRVLDDGTIVDVEIEFDKFVSDSIKRVGAKKTSTKNTPQIPRLDINKVPEDVVLSEYLCRKKLGGVDDLLVETIDELLKKGTKEKAIKFIKKYVLSGS